MDRQYLYEFLCCNLSSENFAIARYHHGTDCNVSMHASHLELWGKETDTKEARETLKTQNLLLLAI